MNNSVVKWVFLPITVILIIITLISASMLSAQSNRLEESTAQINALEGQLSTAVSQISSLQNDVSELASLSSSVASLEASIKNLNTQTPPSIEDKTISQVVAEVKEGVVAINTTHIYTYGWGKYTYEYITEGAGSGWIIDKNGIVITNYHVIENADTISVTLNDGRIFDVDLDTVYYDAANDIAIFKIDASNLTVLKIGNSAGLAVGDWVIAMGNSLNMGVSAKEGIISQLNVSISVESQSMTGLIETSAAINSGNSGGVLLNMKGEVIGITNAKISYVGVEGMGYAININDAIAIIEGFIAEMAIA